MRFRLGIQFSLGAALILLSSCSGLAQPTEVGPSPTPSRTPSPTSTPHPPTSTPIALDAGTLAELEALEDQVEALRGIEPARPLTLEAVTAAGMSEVMEAGLRERYSAEEAAVDAQVLTALGLVDPEFDLWDFYLRLVAEGDRWSFYDHEADTLYVVAGEPLTATARLAYVHQYALALLDEEFDLDGDLGLAGGNCQAIDDRCTAARALAEGDASLLEEQWLRLYASESDVETVIGTYATFESRLFTGAPDYLQSVFLFPFREGSEFVRWFHRRGGWASVDDLYLEPPVTSEAILNPERFEADELIRLDMADDVVDGLDDSWDELSRSSLGELGYRQVLSQQLDREQSQTGADGWGGDLIAIYGNEDDVALAIVQIWDTIRDAQEAYLAWRDYGDLRFGQRERVENGHQWPEGEIFTRMERISNQTLYLLGPDEATVANLRRSLQFPVSKVR